MRQSTLVSLLIARTNFSEFSDDGIIAKNSTRNLAQLIRYCCPSICLHCL